MIFLFLCRAAVRAPVPRAECGAVAVNLTRTVSV